MTDPSDGYEGVAAAFLAGRGRAPSNAIGAREVREWARRLPREAAVADLGCGSGLPMSKILVSEGLNIYGIDAAPSPVGRSSASVATRSGKDVGTMFGQEIGTKTGRCL